ncbi:N-acetylglucosaminyl-phosphatidylinositol deacetylase [Aspergillus ambiguus]|uniref:PIG-L family deacetylase n=1 Tax=Aspergillus ambiguus TaxID=176160 RepID=UPI003CCE507F
MSPSSLVTVGFAIAAVFLFWTLSSTTSSPFARTFPRLYNKRICLLIAHPDDEAMFFAPTVLALTNPEFGNHLKILCLSSGDADGLGHIRKKELQKSALQLGLRSESDVFIVDEPARFRDSMTTTWSEADVADLLASAFTPPPTAKGKGSPATIDVLVTFDSAGVSNHPNHRSLYHGAVRFLRNLMRDRPGYACPVTLYTLTSTSLPRKYIGVLDAPLTMVLGALRTLRSAISASRRRLAKDDMPNRLLFVASVREWMTAQSAMVHAHRSQMVWFRWGWITFGRYMAVNDLNRERVT